MFLTSIVLVALVLATACSFSVHQKPAKTLPQLGDLDVGSDYEIQFINGHPDPTILHIKTNDTYILSTRLRTYESFHWHHYWRIAKSGRLLESFATERNYLFSFAGVSFGEASYNDWPLTGDKHDKEYSRVTNSKDISEKALTKLLSESEQILWDDFGFITNSNAGKEYHFYLKNQNQWSLLISDKKLFNNPQASWPPISHVYTNRSDQENSLENFNEGYLDQKQTDLLYPTSSLAWTDVRFTEEQPVVDVIEFKGFDSEYSVTPSFMSQSGWTGKVGTGHFQLLFDNLLHDFKTYTRQIPHADHKEYDPRMRVAHSLPPADPASFLFLQLTTMGSGDDRDDSGAGVYILRKRNSQSPIGQPPVSHIVFRNFQTSPVIRWVTDASGFRKDWTEKFSEKDVDLSATLKSFPTYVDFYFAAPKPTEGSSPFKLIINDRSWRWDKADSIYVTLYIDPDEMAAALREFGCANLTLGITKEQNDKASRLVVTLESSQRSVQLNSARLVSKASDR